MANSMACEPCGFPDGNDGQSNFRRDPEFMIRRLPPSPYPSKIGISPSKIRSRVPCKATNSQEPLVCEVPGEFDSRFCLQTLEQIFQGSELQWEQMGEDVLTIWTIYLRSSPTGIFLSDVDIMSHILMQISLNYGRISYAKEFLDLIATHLGQGIRVKRFGELTDLKRMAYALTIMGEAVCAGDPSAQAKILKILTIWLDGALGRKNCDKIGSKKKMCGDVREVSRPLPSSVLIQSLELSRLPRVLGDYVKDGAYTSAYVDFLQVLRGCIDCSDIIRRQMLRKPLLDPLLLKLCLDDPGNRILSRTIDLIHSLMGKVVQDNALGTPAPHEGTFQILLTRLFLQLTEFPSQAQLELRNGTAFLICLLVARIPSLGACFGRYSLALGAIVSSNIFGNGQLAVPYLVESTPGDVEFFTFLVWMLDLLLGTSLHIIGEYQLVPGLIAVLMGPSKLIDAMAQVTSIQALESVVWSTLITIAQKSPTSFFVKEGVPAMLQYLKVNNQPETCCDPGLILMFTHLLRIILRCGADLVMEHTRKVFQITGAMTVFVNTVLQLTTRMNCGDGADTILCLSNTLLCCAGLGQFGMEEKLEFLEAGGVRALEGILRQLLRLSDKEKNLNPVLYAAIAECVLKCVAHSPSSLEMFLGHECLLRMLDLLEIGASPLNFLTCILELCEYPRCMDQLLVWRRRDGNMARPQCQVCGDECPLQESSPDSGEMVKEDVPDDETSLSALLCKLWREEEVGLGVLRDKDGCISAIENPLMSEFSRSYNGAKESKGVFLHTPNIPGPAVLDLVGSIRPKIFLLVEKIKEAVNKETKMFEGLGLQDQITMQLITNFVDLKEGEIFLEIMKDFANDDITLEPADAQTGVLLGDITKTKVAAVLDSQRYLIQKSKEIDEIQERQFYKYLVKHCQLQDTIRAVEEAEYLVKTNNYAFLVEMRLRQRKEKKKAFDQIQETPENEDEGYEEMTECPVEPSIADVNANPPENKECTYDLVLEPSAATMADSGDKTPASEDGGFYEVSPEALTTALQQLMAMEKKQIWLKRVGDEDYWRVRTKWRQDWYPEEKQVIRKLGRSSHH